MLHFELTTISISLFLQDSTEYEVVIIVIPS